jgi:amidase
MKEIKLRYLLSLIVIVIIYGCASTDSLLIEGRDDLGGFMENGKTLRVRLNEVEEEYAENWNNNSNVIAFKPVIELAEAIQGGNISSLELVWIFLDRIERFNSRYNAIVTLQFELAIEKAIEADLAYQRGEIWGPLHGIPFTIKDTYETRGLRTTAGYQGYSDHVPGENSAIVNRLLDAGAILLGKTNTPTLAYDMQTNNSLFGRTNNAWNPELTSGGSSGGAAVALATGMTPFEVGSDLAGSLRLPAAFNGVFALRPSFNTASMRGHIPPKLEDVNGLRRMVAPGPLARSAEDLEYIFSIISGPDKNDQRLIPLESRQHLDNLSLSDLKLAWSTNFDNVPVDEQIINQIELFAANLEELGIRITKDSPDSFPFVQFWETWGKLVGMQAGYENSNFARSIGSAFARPTVRNIPMHRKIVDPISVEKYMEALEEQDQAINQLENFLDQYDVWIVPVSSSFAFPHLEPSGYFGDFPIYNEPLLVNGEPVHYYVANQSYTTIFSLTEGPVVTLPIGVVNGLPVGIQLIGKRFKDYELLQIAQLLSETLVPITYPLQSTIAE